MIWLLLLLLVGGCATTGVPTESQFVISCERRGGAIVVEDHELGCYWFEEDTP